MLSGSGILVVFLKIILYITASTESTSIHSYGGENLMSKGWHNKVAGAEPPDPPPSTQFTLNVDRFDTNRPSAAVSRHVTVDVYWTLFFADVDRVDAVSSLTRTFVYLKTVAWFRCINTLRGRSKHVALLWLFQLVGPSYVVSDADSIFTASCYIRV